MKMLKKIACYLLLPFVWLFGFLTMVGLGAMCSMGFIFTTLIATIEKLEDE